MRDTRLDPLVALLRELENDIACSIDDVRLNDRLRRRAMTALNAALDLRWGRVDLLPSGWGVSHPPEVGDCEVCGEKEVVHRVEVVNSPDNKALSYCFGCGAKSATDHDGEVLRFS